MPIVNPSIVQFNTGEITPFLQGRTNFNKYAAAAELMENCLPLVYGPFVKRSGTKYVAPIKYQGKHTILKPFIFSREQAYVLELGDHYIRFHTKYGTIIGDTAICASNNSLLKPEVTDIEKFGEMANHVNGNYKFICRHVDSGEANWEYNNTPITLSQYGITIKNETEVAEFNTITITYQHSGIVEVPTPFGVDDLDSLDFAQSNDFLYITSGKYPVKILKRYSHTDWRIEDMEYEDGPYRDENTNKGSTIKATVATEGSATDLIVTKGDGVFTEDMVGHYIRLRKVAPGSSTEDVIGYVQITEFISKTKVHGLVKSKLFAANLETYAYRLPEFTESRGYPKKLVLFKGRLCLASTEKMPNTVWMSMADSYNNFGPTALHDNEVNDDCAISMTMAANETNKIQWLAAMRQLFIGTLGAEFKVGQMNEVLTPEKAASEEVSQYGTTDIKPCKYANELIYIQQAGRKVRTMYYDLSTDAYNSQDLSLFGEHLTHGGIKGMSQQIEPFPTLWVWLNDGQLRTISYDKSQEVCAWGRVVLGGRQVKVLGATTIPYIDENRDQTWLLVQRYINGNYVQYIEVVEKVFDDSMGQLDGYFVDCGITYDLPETFTSIEPFEYEGEHILLINKENHGLEDGMKIRFSNILTNEGLNDPTSTDHTTWDYSMLNDKAFIVAKVNDNQFAIDCNCSDWIPYLAWQGGVYRVYVDGFDYGLEHLEGEEVYAVVDGAISPKRKVVNGAIKLDSPGCIVHIGLPYSCKYKSVRLDLAMGQNSALASKQKIHHLYIQTYRTNYFMYGGETANTLLPARRYSIDAMDKAPALRSELCEIAFEAPWGRAPKVTIESDLPVPLGILSITTQESLNQ